MMGLLRGMLGTAPFIFPADLLVRMAEERHDDYVHASPFPHAVIDDFLPLQQAELVLRNFPAVDHPAWLDWKGRDTRHEFMKQGVGNASRMHSVSPHLHATFGAFNSYPFINFLEVLTGIGKLLPDPHLQGGGCHQTLNGGMLAVHTDFNYLEKIDLFRRINVLLYLNKSWRPEFGGQLELWDESLQTCGKSIAPIFNRLVVFNTSKASFHGHPVALSHPTGATRKSLALYYYTAKGPPDERFDARTDWRRVTSEGRLEPT